MATVKVNPPPNLRIPKEFAAKNDQRSFFEQIITILFQLRQRTGGNVDIIGEASEVVFDFNPVAAGPSDVSAALKESRNIEVTAIDYTTVTNETVICIDSVTITLNAEPDIQELVVIHAANGKVTIDGNGKTINGETDALIRDDFTTWDVLYITELDSWIII